MQQGVLRLTGNKFLGPGDGERRLHAIDRPLGETDVSHFAGPYGLAQGQHRLFERRFGIVTMALIEIDMAYPEARKRCIQLLEDLRARQTPIRAAHRKIELGGQYIAVAIDARQCFAQHFFGGAAAIDIGRVDQSDAAVEGAMYAGDGIVLLRAVRKREPGSEGDLRYRELTVTQLSIFQCSAPRWYGSVT